MSTCSILYFPCVFFLSVFTSYPQCLEHKPLEGRFSFLFSVCSGPSKKGYRCTALASTTTAGISRAQDTSQGTKLLLIPGCQERYKSPTTWGESCMVREGSLSGGNLGQPECCLFLSLAAFRSSTQEDEGRPPEWERKSKWGCWINDKREIKNKWERRGLFKKKKKSKAKENWGTKKKK